MAEGDDELSRLAREEILQETRRAAVRAVEVGSAGWMKCPLPSTNKRFIRNTILATLTSTRHLKKSTKSNTSEPRRSDDVVNMPTESRKVLTDGGHRNNERLINKFKERSKGNDKRTFSKRNNEESAQTNSKSHKKKRKKLEDT